MKWMNFAGDGRARIRPFAGLYLRTPGRTRFWGWGEPPISAAFMPAATPVAAANDDRPWATLGDWLRAAHSMFGSEGAEQEQTESSAARVADSGSNMIGSDLQRNADEKKRRLRFVCNRHVIGFVFD